MEGLAQGDRREMRLDPGDMLDECWGTQAPSCLEALKVR